MTAALPRNSAQQLAAGVRLYLKSSRGQGPPSRIMNTCDHQMNPRDLNNTARVNSVAQTMAVR